MRVMAGEKYGSDFKHEMTMQAFAAMEDYRNTLQDIDIPIDTMHQFLKHFDFAAEWYAQTKDINKETVSVHFPIAIGLLVHSTGTPYFGAQQEVLQGADYALAMGLKELDDMARPFLLKAIEFTAEAGYNGHREPSTGTD